jgi:prevent-host-death family protein
MPDDSSIFRMPYEDTLARQGPQIAAKDARAHFSRVLNNARIRHEPTIITAHNEPAAAMMPIHDYLFMATLRQYARDAELRALFVKLEERALSREEFHRAVSDALGMRLPAAARRAQKSR